MNIVIVGDVYSKLGRYALEQGLRQLRKQEPINFLIVNGENITHGKGMNKNHYKWLMDLKVNVVTLGNHAFGQKDTEGFIADAHNIVRPANWENVPGAGYAIVNYNGLKICVMQILGTMFMNGVTGITSPFTAIDAILARTACDLYICDMHAETTSEKVALGLCYDGVVDVLFGTHTHVPTADLRILPKGSAYITDVGMTGALDSVLGVKAEIVISRMRDGSRQFFHPETSGAWQFNALLIRYNETEKKIVSAEFITYKGEKS